MAVNTQHSFKIGLIETRTHLNENYDRNKKADTQIVDMRARTTGALSAKPETTFRFFVMSIFVDVCGYESYKHHITTMKNCSSLP